MAFPPQVNATKRVVVPTGTAGSFNDVWASAWGGAATTWGSTWLVGSWSEQDASTTGVIDSTKTKRVTAPAAVSQTNRIIETPNATVVD